MSLFILVILALVVALIVFVVAGIKVQQSSEGGEDMIKSVFIYLVLFATLMMTIGGSIGVFMAVADIVAPTPYYQSFEEFRRWGVPEEKTPEGAVEKIQLSEEELTKRYEAMVSAEKERQTNRARNSLIKSFGWIVIPLPIFMYFQRRLVKKEA